MKDLIEMTARLRAAEEQNEPFYILRRIGDSEAGLFDAPTSELIKKLKSLEGSNVEARVKSGMVIFTNSDTGESLIHPLQFLNLKPRPKDYQIKCEAFSRSTV